MNPSLMVWNLEEVAVKPFTIFYEEMFMVAETSGVCCESIIHGFESPRSCCEAIYKLFQILMVLETSGGCCELIIDDLEFRGGCCEAIYTLLQRNINGFVSFRRVL